MPFDEVFTDIKNRRRIKNREFEPISSSYLWGIENGKNLPPRDKLDFIKDIVGRVAVEQGSENGEAEQAQLEAAWMEDQFVRLGIDPKIAPEIAKLLQLTEDHQTRVVAAINQES